MRLCPKCKSPTLAPLGPAQSGGDPDVVPPSRCTNCRGVWLPHEAVAEHLVPASVDAPVATPSPADVLPGFCPRCRGILVRARVNDENPFHLDRCPICRKKVGDQRAENRHLETIEHALGADVFAKVQAAVKALRKHPMRSLGLSFIVEELRGPDR